MSQHVNVRAASRTERRAASTQRCGRDGGDRGEERREERREERGGAKDAGEEGKGLRKGDRRRNVGRREEEMQEKTVG